MAGWREHKRALAGVALLATLAGVAALPEVRARLAGAYRGFANPGAGEPAAPPEQGNAEAGSGTLEGSELAGDFDLVDTAAEPTSLLDGVVPSLSDLPIPIMRRTLRYVAHYGGDEKGRAAFVSRMKRAERHREFITRSLRDADMPEDLLLLAAVESGFNPQATSPKGAAGMFQFMPETAARFGLVVTGERDERRSIPRSTEAAIEYLRFLHERYGEWDLALAAYNAGEGRVDQAIAEARKALARGDDAPVAFFELAEHQLLPRETRDFVPQIHAFAIVFHNRDLLGLSEAERDAPRPFVEIAVPSGTKLATVARAVGTSITDLREHNPDLLGDRLPGAKGDQLIAIPASELARTLAALPALLAREEQPERSKVASRDDPAPPLPSSERAASGAGTPSEKATSKAAAAKRYQALPDKAGHYLLEGGLVLALMEKPGTEIRLTGAIKLVDPGKNRAPLGEAILLEARDIPAGGLIAGLTKAKAELAAALSDKAQPKLKGALSLRRRAAFKKTGFGPAFEALGKHAFAKGHPLEGALLVGTTEPADDMFLEPLPRWALSVELTLEGPGLSGPPSDELIAALDGWWLPTKSKPLGGAADLALDAEPRHLLVGWASPAPLPADEPAAMLAFMLACHNKAGRLHRALRHERTLASYVNCGLEQSDFGTMAWVLASPSMPFSIADAQKHVDSAISSLLESGPTDSELVAARGLLRAELAREAQTATLRGLPKALVLARNEAVLARIGGVSAKDLQRAAKVLFDPKHRVRISAR